jgi:hypothetical protein
MNRRCLNAHLLHQQTDWNSAQFSQFEQCRGTISVLALSFVRELEQLLAFVGA